MHQLEEDKEWFKEFFDKQYEFIRNYLYYLSGDIDLAEDLTQDAFMQLWQERKHVKRETQKQYLFKVAHNFFLKNYRRKKVSINFVNSLLPENENESPDFVLELKECDQKIQQVLSELPEKTRAIFLMSRIDVMSYNEIALNLDVSVKAVEKHMTKALKILRTKVDRKL